jgi:primase-polymerase (primpol)-like protein
MIHDTSRLQSFSSTHGVALNGSGRPTALAPDFDNFPCELTSRHQWVLWGYEWRLDKRHVGKWAKVPLQPDGARAKSDSSHTWAPFDYVRTAFETGAGVFNGVGFVLSTTDPFVGFDFDHCLDQHFNIIDARIADYVRLLASYTEISPSGTGLRVIVRAKLPPDGRRIGPIECYDSRRFLSITGVSFPYERRPDS